MVKADRSQPPDQDREPHAALHVGYVPLSKKAGGQFNQLSVDPTSWEIPHPMGNSTLLDLA